MFIILAFVALIELSVAAVDPSGPDAGHKTAYITDFKYDALNRLQKKFGRDLGENKPWVTFIYNALGQQTSASSYQYNTAGAQTWNYTVSYTYDPLGRMESKGPSEGGFIGYTHDSAGNVTAIDSTTYRYDELNRLAKVTGFAGETTYRYDAVGNLKSVTLPNQVVSAYTYDALNRLTSLNVEHRDTVTAPRASFDYATAGLTGTGKRLGVNETVGGISRVVRYAYDHRYRLLEEKHGITTTDPKINYVYDKVGNREQRTSTVTGVPAHPDYNYNANDWLINYGAEPLLSTFDQNGNTLRGEVTPTQTADDQYDYANRLIKRTVAGKTIELFYDADGHRVQKKVTEGANVWTTTYTIDDRNPTGYAQVLREETLPYTGSGWLRAYAYGLDLVSTLVNNTDIRHYGYDGHGSVRFLTDNTGAITDTYTYDAFGILLASTGTTPNHLLYAGEYLDPDLRLYYLRARWNNPLTGRFWTSDPHPGHPTDPLSLHKYLYCHADPVNNIDPSGQFLAGVSEVLLAAQQRIYVHATTFVVTRPILARVVGLIAGLFVSAQFDTAALQGLPQFQGLNALQAAEVKLLDAVKRGPIYDGLTKELKGMMSRETGLAFQDFLQRNVFKVIVEANKRVSSLTKHEVDYVLDGAIVEAKHTKHIDSEQLAAIAKFAKNEGKEFWYVFVQKPGQGVIDRIKNAGGKVGWFLDETD